MSVGPYGGCEMQLPDAEPVGKTATLVKECIHFVSAVTNLA